MTVNSFKGYIEGRDLTKIPQENLAFPSKNVFVQNNAIFTRGGIKNDGTPKTQQVGIHSEFVWKDAVGGLRALRVYGSTLQVKHDGYWVDVFTGLDPQTSRVFFATWVDNNNSIVKKRLFFSDGSENLYQWNGAIAYAETVEGNDVTVGGERTLEQMGFDSSPRNVVVTSRNEEKQQVKSTDSSYASGTNIQSKTINFSDSAAKPKVGDLVIQKPTSETAVNGFKIDVVYSYKNHIILANYNSVRLYFSHVQDYSSSNGLNFTQSSSATALTSFFLTLDANFTAIISRKNKLWVSDSDDWYKIIKTEEQNAYGTFVDVEKVETGDQKGALPMACSKYKGDIMYISQDKTIQRVTTLEVAGTDEFRNQSQDIEGMLRRYDVRDVRVYYVERAIYIILPFEGVTILLDMLEGYFQPPQTLPMSCMSIINGVKYGHHVSQNETFELFTGRKDLGISVNAVIAFGYQHGNEPLQRKQHTQIGVSARATRATKINVLQEMESDGQKYSSQFEVDGNTAKSYSINDTESWGSYLLGTRGYGGADFEAQDMRRIFFFAKNTAVPYFEFRPVFTIAGDDAEFHLLAYRTDASYANKKMGSELYTARNSGVASEQ